MTANIPLIGAVASIEAVDIIPANGFEWTKLAVQLILGVLGFLHHRRLAKDAKNNKNQ
jgi:hypothetical protein